MIYSVNLFAPLKLLRFSLPPIILNMVKEEKKQQFIAIKSMFLSGSVSRMKDIEKLYPTKVSKALGMNHS